MPGRVPELAVLFVDLIPSRTSATQATPSATTCCPGRATLRAQSGRMPRWWRARVATIRRRDPRSRAAERARGLGERIVESLAEPLEFLGGQQGCGASVGIALCPATPAACWNCFAAPTSRSTRRRTPDAGDPPFDPALDSEIRRRHDLLAALRWRSTITSCRCTSSRGCGSRTVASSRRRRWCAGFLRPGFGLSCRPASSSRRRAPGLINRLGLQVLDETLRQLASGSRATAFRSHLRQRVAAAIRDAPGGPRPRRLVATRRRALAPGTGGHGERVVRRRDGGELAAAALRAMGVTIAMDDFGTGYSSMACCARCQST